MIMNIKITGMYKVCYRRKHLCTPHIKVIYIQKPTTFF